MKLLCADARALPLRDASVDLIVTSPPYWKKRDYGFSEQIGREQTVAEYVATMSQVLREWRRVLRDTGSIFLNVGDTYVDGSLAGVPSRLEIAALDDGWLVPNRIVWAKPSGMPSPVRTRLVSRHECVLHLAKTDKYFYDRDGYAESSLSRLDVGDVWQIALRPKKDDHLAPFPPELVERAILLACPTGVCPMCGEPKRRIMERTNQLNPERAQARRAMEKAREVGLTDEHLAAIRATGIADAGKAQQWQGPATKNSARVQKLAAEAKKLLGGYFREFTFPLWATSGFTECPCGVPAKPGVVLDPFCGTGTTLDVADALGRSSIGSDYRPIRVAQEEASARTDTLPDPEIAPEAGDEITTAKPLPRRKRKTVAA